MKRTLVLLVLVLISGCPKPVPVPPVPPIDGATCDTACDRLRELGCEAAQPTPAGESCEAVCENVQASGIVKFDLDCRSTAPSCDAIDACES